jgi:phosphoribosylformylglycinamidine cyclo-ligase
MKEPIYLIARHGVGRKVEIALQMGIFTTIGEDLVSLIADGLAAEGATPLHMRSHITAGQALDGRTEEIRSGIKKGALKAGIEILTDESIAEHSHDDGDGPNIFGMATAVVDAELRLKSDRVKAGDLIVAMPASGFHASGFSLVLHILAEQELELNRNYDFTQSLGEVLLTSAEIYTLDCLALINAQQENIRIFSHIAEGGIAANTARVIPDGLVAIYDRSTWSLPHEMKFLADIASLSQADLERIWNAGIGMSAIVDPLVADLIVRSLAARGMKAWIAGKVEKAAEKGAPRAYLTSEYK